MIPTKLALEISASPSPSGSQRGFSQPPKGASAAAKPPVTRIVVPQENPNYFTEWSIPLNRITALTVNLALTAAEGPGEYEMTFVA